ncbi:MAG: DUF1573 domain-containing protein [Candidatus Gracilibacteria bacterium]
MKNILILVLVISIVFGLILYSKENVSENKTFDTISSSQIKITKNNINLGEIPMDEGKTNISFEFINTGTEDIILANAETSCLCTEGLITNEEGAIISETIVMIGHGSILNLRQTIKPKEKLYLIAVFDPNAHGPDATGPISRNIFIKTNSNITPELNFNFLGNVVKSRTIPKIDNIKKETVNIGDFSFDKTSFDFGVIKQSGGIVKHDFKFTYNGEKQIKVTGVPTSCACTTTTIDKTEFKKGDNGILTVIFNPNLHAEPEGKFFKTASILTESNQEKIPEVKIWAEIDLDLGKEAFELRAEHID